jgi:hypothetical protein
VVVPVDQVVVPIAEPFVAVLSICVAIVPNGKPWISLMATIVLADTVGDTVTPVSEPSAILAKR